MMTAFLALIGFSSGILVSTGVFTVLFVVGLVPRFAGTTNTARYGITYENSIIAGAVIGCILSVFPIGFAIAPGLAGRIMLCIIGIFMGIFVGCIAISVAELLDSLPILGRRIKLKKGIGIVLLSIAAGKAAGSLLYYIQGFGE